MIEPLVGTAIGLVFWVTLALYGFSSLWWLLEVTVLATGWQADDESEIPLGNIQVRILTYNSPSTVQVTVNSVPERIGATKVIAEADMDIDGADVHVVPDDFESQAQRRAEPSNGPENTSSASRSTSCISMRTASWSTSRAAGGRSDPDFGASAANRLVVGLPL
ncbi:hypothetical protein [Halonotius sp. GCM10025705]|uniref:hypothetical protein n=1 Tax=Halonotius sp. GCM10025705 TaxID=3252678 RepID=UPI00360F6C80